MALTMLLVLAGCARSGPSVAAFCGRAAAAGAAHQALDNAAFGPGPHDPTTLQQLSGPVIALDSSLVAVLPGRLGADGRTLLANDRSVLAALDRAGFHDDQMVSPLTGTEAVQSQTAAADIGRYRELVCHGESGPSQSAHRVSGAGS